MEGMYFYWISWCCWLIFTFLAPKNKLRFIICSLILLAIISSATYFQLYTFEIHATFLLLMITTSVYIAKQPWQKIMYLLFTSLVLTFTYVSFYLFAIYDPVWVIFSEKVMSAALIVYITLLLHKSYLDRIVAAALGMLQGQLLYAIILKRYQMDIPIGDLVYLDTLAISLFVLFCWNLLEHYSKIFEKIVQKIVERKAGMNG